MGFFPFSQPHAVLLFNPGYGRALNPLVLGSPKSTSDIRVIAQLLAKLDLYGLDMLPSPCA
jgi:hypothetical protein